MANLTSKDKVIKLDNASASLTDISGNVNSDALERAITILDDTATGDTEHSTLPGLLQAPRIPLNGWLNSTIDDILGPIMASGTSITKRFEVQPYSGRYYNAECYIENIRYSGSPDTLQVWSCDLVGSGTLNRTTKALS